MVFCAAAIGIVAHAQVSITLQVPPNGVLQKNQLWNLVMVSSSTTAINVSIDLTLVNTRNNQPVLTAETRTLTLTKGARQVKTEDVSPIKYTYLSAVADRNPNGLLPIGSFTACYTVSVLGHEGKVVLAEDCVPVEVEPLNPPLLNMPADGAAIETVYPQFNWLPPAPLNLFSNLNYDLKLVEVLKGQSPLQAIQQNIPVYSVNARDLFNNYPASNKALDTGRLYAWRIVAKDNSEFAGQSETWTFRVAGKAIKTTVKDESYYKLKKGNESAYAICTGMLKMEYTNDANDPSVNYSIIDLGNAKSPLVKQGTFKLNYGQNLIDLSLARELVNGKRYLLQLENSRNEKWGITFTYIDTDKNQ